jgi:hypothetical protein
MNLLTGGLLVRVQPEEPIKSTSYGQRMFLLIFTLPFFEPISCGFFVSAEKHPDARESATTFPDQFPRNLLTFNMIL